MSLRIVEDAAHSDVGRQRNSNEDSYYYAPPVFAVADGMGGAQAGEVASQIAVETFDGERDTAASPEEQLAQVAKAANRKIFKMAREDDARAGMGTTFLGAMVSGNDVAIGHVGDSRAYRFRDDKLERLTDDHSLVEEFVRQGKLTPEEAEVHPQRSIITRALGPEAEVEVETCTYPGRDGDVYLLCSDGLTGMVPEDRMTQILRERSSLENAATELIAAANENGGRDNITVVLFRLGTDAGDDDEADTLSDQETKVGVDTTAVREAVAAADAEDATVVPRDDDATVVPRAGDDADDEAEQPTRIRSPAARDQTTARRATTKPRKAEPEATSAKGKAPKAARSPASGSARRRGPATLLIVLLALVALAAGIYYGSRQFFFVGTDDRGLVTLYRGLPYDLPLEVSLYERVFVSTVPARSLPPRRRSRILDHQLRSEGDAVDLIRGLERSGSGTRL